MLIYKQSNKRGGFTMSDYWDNSPVEEELEENDEFVDETFIFVNGSKVNIAPGANFINAVKDTAKNAGLGKFRVFLNGSEVLPSESPDVFEEGYHVELRKYDVAG
jgi:hypothetical protein